METRETTRETGHCYCCYRRTPLPLSRVGMRELRASITLLVVEGFGRSSVCCALGMPALISSTQRLGLLDYRYDAVAVSASGRVGLMAGIKQPKLTPILCVNITFAVDGLQCRGLVIIVVRLARKRRSDDTSYIARWCCLGRRCNMTGGEISE